MPEVGQEDRGMKLRGNTILFKSRPEFFEKE